MEAMTPTSPYTAANPRGPKKIAFPERVRKTVKAMIITAIKAAIRGRVDLNPCRKVKSKPKWVMLRTSPDWRLKKSINQRDRGNRAKTMDRASCHVRLLGLILS